MILSKESRHTDRELLSYSASLYQVALCAHAASHAMTKRSLLFLYLFGWRYISRRQIYSLLAYDPSSGQSSKNAEEFIGKFIRADLLRKCNADKSDTDNAVFTASKKGVELGRQYFIEEVQRIHNTKNIFYSRYVDVLLLGERDNLDEYIRIFGDYTTERYRNKLRSTVHRLSTMDSYISFLRHLLPATVAWFGTEVKFYRGEVCGDDSNLFSASTDVRSDALFHLALCRTGQMTAATGGNTHLVCIEQDTSHQTSAVLQDKIERYVNLIALPRYDRYAVPPTLIFSVIPSFRPAKRLAHTSVHACGLSYVEDLTRFAILYCHHCGKSLEQVTLGELEGELVASGGGSPLFDKYLKFLNEHAGEYSKYLPLSRLNDRYHELAAQDDGTGAYRRKVTASFQARRSTIFSAAARVECIGLMARTGFSVCAVSNYEPASLLSLFPELARGRELLSMVCPETGDGRTTIRFSPFYRHRCQNGMEITFRNVYHLGDRLFVMENIAEDYCGYLRLKELLAGEPELPLQFLAVFPVADYVKHTKELYSMASARQRDSLYGCAYRADTDGNILYVAPILISRLFI